jgi:acyl-coenzyme A synthetase/AMP-(fatty) acid ligase
MMGSPLPPTFWELVVQAAKEHPDSIVVSDDHGRSLTRSQLQDAAEITAAALSDRGVSTDTVVSWQLPTTIEAVVLLVALARIGAIQNPLIPILREREVSFITQQIGTQLLVVPEVWRGFPHGAMARELATSGDFEVMEIDLHDLNTGRSRYGLNLPTADPKTLDRSPSPSIDGARWIYYSSGTTADPKGARHTDTSIMSSSNALLELMGFGEDDIYPIPWPITHIGGASVLASSIRGGVHLILFESFDPTETPRRMAVYSPTALGTAVPFFRA